MPTASFGHWLSQRRKALGFTQEELAERISCSGSLIRKLEAGQRIPSREIAEQLCPLLHIAPSERDAFVQFARGLLPAAKIETQLWQSLHAHTAPSHPTNLPAPLTPLIGRERELEKLRNLLLSHPNRLLTLTGPPGIGKTRLSLHAGIDMLDHYQDGVFFVSLATVHNPARVVPAIAEVLGIPEERSESHLTTLRKALRDKEILLVLDNFEQILDAAPTIAELLAAAPRLKVLVTSREPLYLHGEQQFPVPALEVPMPSHTHWMMDATANSAHRAPAHGAAMSVAGGQRSVVDDLTGYSAMRLFVERAISVKPDFALTEENVASVADICVLLDGLPLAIELAAARVKLLSLHEIHSRLQSHNPQSELLTMLAGGSRNLPVRQRTLRNAIEWSCQLLDPGERLLFARLSAFVGGCTLSAAQAVCKPDDLPFDLLHGISSLIDKSLLKREEILGESRYIMLEMIREYAAERLAAGSEAEQIKKLHALYFLDLAEAAEAGLNGPDQRRIVQQLEADHDNIRAALRWAREKGSGTGPESQEALDIGLRIAGAIRHFWLLRSSYSEGRDQLQRLLSLSHQPTPAPSSRRARAKALAAVGRLAYRQGDYSTACSVLEESLFIRREISDKAGIAWSLTYLAMSRLQQMMLSHANQADYSIPRSMQEEGLSLHREVSDKWGIAISLEQLGIMAYLAGDYSSARPLFEESLALHRELGQRSSIGVLTYELGMVAYLAGDYSTARPLAEESLTLQYELGYTMGIALSLAGVGEVTVETGHPGKGARLLAASEALYEAIGGAMEACDRIAYSRAITSACSQLGDVEFRTAWQEGRAMSAVQAITLAFEDSAAHVS